MSVVIRQSEGLMTATPAEFENEAELERILMDRVTLLQASGDPEVACVDRQVGLSGVGSLDLLCVDANGLPIAVEVKLARNGESRRSVVAQIVDYLSALTSLTVDELDVAVEGRLEAALRSFDEPAAQEGFDRRWQAAGANLRAGLARIVVALDDAPADLRRIVRFLSAHSSLDIRLVTVSKFTDAGIGTVYVPNIIVGIEDRMTRTSKVRSGRSAEEFRMMWERKFGPEAGTAWKTFRTALEQSGIEGLSFGTSAGGRPQLLLKTDAGPVMLLWLADIGADRAEARDLLNKGGLWSRSQAAAARDSFRASLIRLVPGAIVAGGVGRVYAPVDSLAAHADAVLPLFADLAREIRLAVRENDARLARDTDLDEGED